MGVIVEILAGAQTLQGNCQQSLLINGRNNKIMSDFDICNFCCLPLLISEEKFESFCCSYSQVHTTIKCNMQFFRAANIYFFLKGHMSD